METQFARQTKGDRPCKSTALSGQTWLTGCRYCLLQSTGTFETLPIMYLYFEFSFIKTEMDTCLILIENLYLYAKYTPADP